jgi:hypothetical protein
VLFHRLAGKFPIRPNHESRSAKSPKAFAGSASPIRSWSTERTASWPVMAASRRRELGMATAPCLRIEHMLAAEKRAYVLADNKLAINAGWDEELLALELKELMEADLGFDIEVTGFTIPEVDQLMEGLAPEEPGDPADDRLPDPTGSLLMQARRSVAFGAPSSRLRRRARSRSRGRTDGRREGGNGLHRPTLQCRDRRQRERARQDPPS